jgi:hypothetical protein
MVLQRQKKGGASILDGVGDQAGKQRQELLRRYASGARTGSAEVQR